MWNFTWWKISIRQDTLIAYRDSYEMFVIFAINYSCSEFESSLITAELVLSSMWLKEYKAANYNLTILKEGTQ